MALYEELSLDYDKATFSAWQELFGESFTKRLDSQLRHLMVKSPTNTREISVKFAGDISTITAEDVASKKARVTANSMVDGRQTLWNKIRTTFGKGLFHSKAVDKTINHVIICTVVIIPPTEEEKTKSVDNEA